MTWRDAYHAIAARNATEKPTLRRFTWCRWHHDLTYSPLWPLVAQRAGVPQPVVEAFVQRLEVYASSNNPRGSLEGFNVAALAAVWHMNEDAIARIYVQLEKPDVGWIEQDCVHSFWERNPDQEDRTAAARQQRKRDRAKGMRWLAKAARTGQITTEQRTALEIELYNSADPRELSTDWERHGASRRDSVTVTARADQIDTARSEKEGLIDQGKVGDSHSSNPTIPTNSGESGDSITDPDLWLAIEGKRIVTERLKAHPERAKLEIDRWRRDVGDAATLVRIIHEADTMGLTGGRFTDRVRTEITNYHFNAKGPPLPLKPKIVRASRHG